jgi:hypothetical protein
MNSLQVKELRKRLNGVCKVKSSSNPFNSNIKHVSILFDGTKEYTSMGSVFSGEFIEKHKLIFNTYNWVLDNTKQPN